MKHVALILALLGLAFIGAAMRMDSESSFEDGTFLLQIVMGVLGLLCVVAGAAIIFIMLLGLI
jgi:hypothetical protein